MKGISIQIIRLSNTERFVGGSYRFHRAELQQALLSCQSDRMHLSHRLISYEETAEEIHLHFEGGRTATCDLIIGMDGIKSVVRRSFLTKQGSSDSRSLNPVWSGEVAYRSLIPIEKLEEEFPGHRAITTPLVVSFMSACHVAFLQSLFYSTSGSLRSEITKNCERATTQSRIAFGILPSVAGQIHQLCRSLHRPIQRRNPI